MKNYPGEKEAINLVLAAYRSVKSAGNDDLGQLIDRIENAVNQYDRYTIPEIIRSGSLANNQSRILMLSSEINEFIATYMDLGIDDRQISSELGDAFITAKKAEPLASKVPQAITPNDIDHTVELLRFITAKLGNAISLFKRKNE